MGVPLMRATKERRRSRAGRRWTDGLWDSIEQHAEEIAVGPLRICDKQKKVFIDGEQKQLTPREYELLRILATNSGKVLSNEELASNLGNGKRCPDPEEVKKYVYRLRKKVESDLCSPRLIKNVKGFGYQLIFDDDENVTQ